MKVETLCDVHGIDYRVCLACYEKAYRRAGAKPDWEGISRALHNLFFGGSVVDSKP